jgi:dethiobiotin synthetase
MTKGIFITGTDTGVGKTYVATGIASALRSRGIDVGVMKPAETGCRIRAGKLVPSDALNLMKAANVHDALSNVNPYRFRNPLAPLVAAELEGKKIAEDKILSAWYTLSRRHEFMIVEGAGGIMVPLTEKYLYRDLAAAFGLPVLIVVRPGLGTINHTLLTISVLQEKDITISGIVVNYADSRKTGPAEKTSPAVIERISGVKIVGIVQHGSREFGSIASYLT